MKVLNISPHRSGTQSFHNLCLDHGYKSTHFPGDWLDAESEKYLEYNNLNGLFDLMLPMIESHQIFSDLPYPLLYKKIFGSWSDTKLLLITRNVIDWIDSVRRHTKNRQLSFLEKWFYWSFCGRPENYMDNYADQELYDCYNYYLDDVRFFVRATGADFSEFILEDNELGKKLAKFIGFELKVPLKHISV